MDQATLVGPDVSAGFEALATLYAAHIKRLVAVMIQTPEYEDWRFILSSPTLDQVHLLKAYDQVAAAFDGRFVRSLPLFIVLKTKDPFIRELRRLYSKSKDVAGTRLGGQMIGDRFVTNGYVFQVA